MGYTVFPKISAGKIACFLGTVTCGPPTYSQTLKLMLREPRMPLHDRGCPRQCPATD